MIGPRFAPLTISDVCVKKSGVPAIDLSMFIFLGSVLLSVQKRRLSIIFIPVIKLPSSKPKTLLLP